MSSILALDAWLLFGAVAQCALILRARRFDGVDWVAPLALLILMPTAWFVFIWICSTTGDAADLFFIGLAFGVTAAAFCVITAAPPRLNATALLSLNVTFWASYHMRGSRPEWFRAAILMSSLSVLFAVGPWKAPVPARVALYAWSLVAAATILAYGASTKVSYALFDYHHIFPAGLSLAEAVITGAQCLLFMQFLIGLILFLPISTAGSGWKYADRMIDSYDADARLGWPALAVLLAQTAALAWAQRAGGEIQSEFLSLAPVAALAHGAMSGEDAGGATPPPEPGLVISLTPDERYYLGRWRRFFAPFLAIALASGVCSSARAASDDDAAAPAAAPVLAPRPEHVVMGDSNTDPGKIFRGKGGRDKAIPGGAVMIDASGNRLEIAPTKRPKTAAQIISAAAPAGLSLPSLPTLDDPKAGLAERRQRAQFLLGGSAAAAFLLIYWARRRWRPDV